MTKRRPSRTNVHVLEEHRALERLERELDLVRRRGFELDEAAPILGTGWRRPGVEP